MLQDTLACSHIINCQNSNNNCAVYVLDEIAQLATGGGETAQGLADATIKRLGNRSPIVKQKVCMSKTMSAIIPTLNPQPKCSVGTEAY